jgi:hypothetical protein
VDIEAFTPIDVPQIVICRAVVHAHISTIADVDTGFSFVAAPAG